MCVSTRVHTSCCVSGDQVASYRELGYRSPVSDVQFHPHDHIVAFCAFGDNQPVLVYKFDHEGQLIS